MIEVMEVVGAPQGFDEGRRELEKLSRRLTAIRLQSARDGKETVISGSTWK